MNQTLAELILPNQCTLQIVAGDLTTEHVEAVVNAANAQLLHGGGVAGAIVRHGGVEIQIESNEWVRNHGPVSHDQPAFTRAGRLPCRYIIHAVGPVWGSGDEDNKLTAAVKGSFKLADQLELSSIALPAISTGVFGFPTKRAARVILAAILDYFTQTPDTNLKQVRLTLIDPHTQQIFMEALKKFEPDP